MAKKIISISEWHSMATPDVASALKQFDSLEIVEDEEKLGYVGWYSILKREVLYTVVWETWNSIQSLTGEESCSLEEAIMTVNETINQTTEDDE